MFWVSDTMERRHERIRAFDSREEILIGFMISAMDFEWTLRRAVLSLSTKRTATIREALERCHGLDGYKSIWKTYVRPVHGLGLPAVIPQWKELREKAFKLRHKLAHGARGSASSDYARERRELFLASSKALIDYALSKDVDLYRRLKVRLKDR